MHDLDCGTLIDALRNRTTVDGFENTLHLSGMTTVVLAVRLGTQGPNAELEDVCNRLQHLTWNERILGE